MLMSNYIYVKSNVFTINVSTSIYLKKVQIKITLNFSVNPEGDSALLPHPCLN